MGCTNLSQIEVEEGNPVYDSRENSNSVIETATNTLIAGCKNSTIPNTVTSIGGGAFAELASLTEITIPKSVTSVGMNVFTACDNLTRISVEKGNPVYDSRENSNSVIETATNTLVAGCKNSTIPNSVTSIGLSAFYGCASLTSITIPNKVTSIGYSAFGYCSNLASVISEIEEPFAIKNYAFDNISNDCVLYIPNGTKDTYIAAGWTEDVFKGGIVEMDRDDDIIAFADDNVKAICVEHWDTDGDGELSKAEAAAVTDLGPQLGFFNYNKDITSFDELQYFTALTTIGAYAFSHCNSLKSIIIPDNVKTISTGVFDGCSGLTSITIPNNVKTLGITAFRDCSALTSIIIPSSVTSIEPQTLGGCTSLTSIKVEPDNPVYDSRNDCNAIIETRSNTLVQGCNNTTIPDNITTIGEDAFYGCTFTSISIPSNVTSIGIGAFYRCFNLITITIPEKVTSIEWDAFVLCYALTSVEIMREEPFSIGLEEELFYSGAFYKPGNIDLIVPAGTAEKYKNTEHWKDFRSIKERVKTSTYSYVVDPDNTEDIAISGTNDTNATAVDIPYYMKYDGKVYAVTEIATNAFANYGNMESVVIPDDITKIGDAAFENCASLQGVVLPTQTTEIGDKAFAGCTSMTEVKALNTTPPSISEGTFSEETMQTATLYVPIGCKETYEAAEYWSSFANIVEKDMSDDVTVVSEAAASGQANVSAIYAPDGSKLKADSTAGLGKGVYVVHYTNGTVKKVWIR